MILLEAIPLRHSVRRYTDRAIEPQKQDKIRALIEKCNAESGLHIQLVTDEPLAFSTGVFKYGKFAGVRNYLALVAPRQGRYDEAIGYYGQKLVLYMQTLGLNTCWVALTYRKIKDAYKLRQGEQLKLVIACGYGQTNGTAHPQKKRFDDFCRDRRSSAGEYPEWFRRGVEAAMLAPTAINQQKFLFTLLPGDRVRAKAGFDIFGNSGYDLGIAKCHFELAAGTENFSWDEPKQQH